MATYASRSGTIYTTSGATNILIQAIVFTIRTFQLASLVPQITDICIRTCPHVSYGSTVRELSILESVAIPSYSICSDSHVSTSRPSRISITSKQHINHNTSSHTRIIIRTNCHHRSKDNVGLCTSLVTYRLVNHNGRFT